MTSPLEPNMDPRPMTDDLPEPRAVLPPPQNPAQARPVRQLDSIIENLTTYAGPVLREIAARAAELAAKAGEAAGPLAHKAAGKTEGIGERVADRSRAIATDLRRDPAGSSTSDEPGGQPGVAWDTPPGDTFAEDAGGPAPATIVHPQPPPPPAAAWPEEAPRD